ncbi:ABC transporter ATP-binding protein [Alkalihalobacterium chitinilyticum]|uniref:ABC transporter ATP-binding protein n=1 Tax=Alkalihalobacterium chitinilyticum TaxID=2980103 RepID=A0ABT5VJS4_9BACI|nr:ABC transporter ATP-binding protein [Alkalihalobacterium chitinilyticum]MDE5415705.1 ABC transporter ATP-binding protein [Alkalihalobacterium chitinilyticum]
MSTPILSVENVTKRYGTKKALDNITFSVNQPGIIGLIGANGSGKSTLLKLIAGLLKTSTGTVQLIGNNVSRKTTKHCAYLSEDDDLYPFYTVKDTLLFYEKVFPDFERSKSENILNDINVSMEEKIGHLSKGNRARVKIALALGRKVPCLLLDEPLSGLDPIVREDIIKAFAKYADLEKQLIILSTHEVEEIEPLLDQVLFIKDGSILYFNEVEQLREERGQSVIDFMREVLK